MKKLQKIALLISLALFVPGFLMAQQQWDTNGNAIGAYDFLGTTNSRALTFKTNGLKRMTITADGKVGIGGISPSASLHVEGDLKLQAPNNHTFIISTGNDGDLHFIGDGDDALTITDDNGRVGVGTPDPLAQFQVIGDVSIGALAVPEGYMLAVDGKVIAKEIRVQADPWPDYVFKNDYSLPALPELESQIRAAGHLPGIPSAEEVNAEGIELGDMNRRLLEKVEELTLYLIEQDKQIRALQEDVRELKRQ